jgi:hypothetical protein
MKFRMQYSIYQYAMVRFLAWGKAVWRSLPILHSEFVKSVDLIPPVHFDETGTHLTKKLLLHNS